MTRDPRESQGVPKGNSATTPQGTPELAADPKVDLPDGQVAEALRLLRIRHGLSQIAASRLKGAPNVRTIAHWETDRKLPSLKYLIPYLSSLGLDLVDFQDALNEVQAPHPTGVRTDLDKLELRVSDMENRLRRIERKAQRPRAVTLPSARRLQARTGPM